MGKVTMPKNTAKLHEIHAALEIYYNADGWLLGTDYIPLMQAKIGADKGRDEYPKKENILSYFGFTEREFIDRRNKKKRITPIGKKLWEAISTNNTNMKLQAIMESLETVTFGKNNHGSLETDTNIEPPCLFIKGILDLGYLTYKEFAFLLWRIADCCVDYDTALAELRRHRTEASFSLDESAKKYTDAKPIMLLLRWGFLAEDGKAIGGAEKLIISEKALSLFEARLKKLSILNTEKELQAKIALSSKGIKKAKKEIAKIDKEDIADDSEFIAEVNSKLEAQVNLADVSYAPREVGKKKEGKKGIKYIRDPYISRLALKLAEHRCELCNEETRLFIRKSDGTIYTEPHHLIPICCQDDLPDSKSLDHIANIVSLCSHCHNLLHYGRFEDKKDLIEKLYTERKEKLAESGINIDLGALCEIYK